VHFCSTRHKPDFGGKSEAGKSEAIVSARQHRPEGQNPIASVTSRRNTAQAWLRGKARRSMTWKTGLENWEPAWRKGWRKRFGEKIVLDQKNAATIDSNRAKTR
jgi:hypothetical protein